MAIKLPIGIRVAAGLLGTAIDRVGKLPQELPTMGVTLAGQVIRTSMRLRQEIAELATRGDDLLSGITGGAEEHPAWATFDEDDDGEKSFGPDSRPADRTRDSHPVDTRPARAQPIRTRPTRAAPAKARPTPAEPTGSRPDPSEPADLPPADLPPADLPPADLPPAHLPPADAATVDRRAATQATARAASAAARRSPATGTPRRSAAAGPHSPGRTRSAAPKRTPTPHGEHKEPTDRGSVDAGGVGDGSINGDHRFSISELKERLQGLDSAAVRVLLAQEEAGPGRAAYLTLLTNRLTTLQHENR